MSEIIWEDPPENLGPEFWRTLQEHPGKWAIYPYTLKGLWSLSHYYNKKSTHGRFEVRQRNNKGYVRYVEEESHD